MRPLSLTLQQNLFTTVARPTLPAPHYGQRPENVFNNKADFKVLLPSICVNDAAATVRQGSRRTRASPAWEKLKDGDERPPSGSGRRVAADMPWLNRYPRGVDWHMPLKVAPLYRLARRRGRRHRALPCTNFLGKTLTYARDRRAWSTRATAGLQRLGVKKGTKVGLFLPNSPTFIVYFFAVLKAGGTIVNYNPLYTVSELAVPGQGQRHRTDGDARPAGAVRQGRGAAAVGRA